MKKGLVITGTNTDTGKTMCTRYLINTFARHNINSIALKPFQTGVDAKSIISVTENDDLYKIYITEDAFQNHLKHDKAKYFKKFFSFIKAIKRKPITKISIKDDFSAKNWNKYCIAKSLQNLYKKPCSPHLAINFESDENIKINHKFEKNSVKEIAKKIKKAKDIAKYDIVVVEGAGGIYVPINEKESFADLSKRLGFPAIIVSNGQLGEINALLTTIDSMKKSHVDINGFVISDKNGNLFNNKCNCNYNINIKKDHIKPIKKSIKEIGNLEFTLLSNHTIISQISTKSYKSKSDHNFEDRQKLLFSKSKQICNYCWRRILSFDNIRIVQKISKTLFLGFVPYLSSDKGELDSLSNKSDFIDISSFL